MHQKYHSSVCNDIDRLSYRTILYRSTFLTFPMPINPPSYRVQLNRYFYRTLHNSFAIDTSTVTSPFPSGGEEADEIDARHGHGPSTDAVHACLGRLGRRGRRSRADLSHAPFLAPCQATPPFWHPAKTHLLLQYTFDYRPSSKFHRNLIGHQILNKHGFSIDYIGEMHIQFYHRLASIFYHS